MKSRKSRRAWVIGLVLLGIGTATALVLSALDDSLSFFYSPSEIAEGLAPDDRAFRVGGLVETGSVARYPDEARIAFAVTDGPHSVAVSYIGIVPDLFREGQGVIAEGRFGDGGIFVADSLLARHDENYMPPEVADAMARGGDPRFAISEDAP